MMNPTAILISDIHLRDDTPEAWTGNYQDAQHSAINFIKELQIEYECPILCGGDVFDKWQGFTGQCDHKLMVWALENMPKDMHTVAGQHDLPNHNADLISKSALAVLEAANLISIVKEGDQQVVVGRSGQDSFRIFGFPWGSDITNCRRSDRETLRRVAMIHYLTWQVDVPYPGCTTESGSALLEKMSGFDLVLSGDNHKPFVARSNDGRILVNPGSMLPMKADQMRHKPRVYLWFSKDNEVEPVYLPVPEKPMTREHIQKQKNKDERMKAFAQKLSSSAELGLSFEDNLKQYMGGGKVSKQVQDIVWEAVEG